jgi:hypothetical protein
LRARSAATLKSASRRCDPALGAGQPLELGREPGARRQHVLDRRAVLPEQALEAIHAILDLGEPVGIGLGALGVA